MRAVYCHIKYGNTGQLLALVLSQHDWDEAQCAVSRAAPTANVIAVCNESITFRDETVNTRRSLAKRHQSRYTV
jgi:hypothetical protein